MCVIALRAQGRIVGCVSQALRQGRRSDTGLAGRHAHDEPVCSAVVIDEAMERDPLSAAAEYGAQFRSDIESYITRECVEACVSLGVRERLPVYDVTYSAFVDPSGGSADSMTLAVGHREDTVVVVDAIREVKPPFSPEDVVDEFVTTLRKYRIIKITGDRYAGEWPREQFGSSASPMSPPLSRSLISIAICCRASIHGASICSIIRVSSISWSRSNVGQHAAGVTLLIMLLARMMILQTPLLAVSLV